MSLPRGCGQMLAGLLLSEARGPGWPLKRWQLAEGSAGLLTAEPTCGLSAWLGLPLDGAWSRERALRGSQAKLHLPSPAPAPAPVLVLAQPRPAGPTPGWWAQSRAGEVLGVGWEEHGLQLHTLHILHPRGPQTL